MSSTALMVEPTADTAGEHVRRRWEKATRYYEAYVDQDLWGGWVLTRVWGRRGTRLGQIRRAPFGSYAEALDQLAAVAERREKRGYAPVGIRPSTLTP